MAEEKGDGGGEGSVSIVSSRWTDRGRGDEVDFVEGEDVEGGMERCEGEWIER